jgi:hypothetical protein
MFENSVLMQAVLPKSGETTGELRRLHNKELYNLYSSPNFQVLKSRRIKLSRYVANMENKRGTYRILVGRPHGKSQHERPTIAWENNVKRDLQEVGWGGTD